MFLPIVVCCQLPPRGLAWPRLDDDDDEELLEPLLLVLELEPELLPVLRESDETLRVPDVLLVPFE